MKYIKLKEYCEAKSISYASGNRWFKKGLIPGAYQTGTGTILVPSDEPEAAEKGDNAMSMFLKKTVEFSKNEGSIEDFAAWVLSTFSLKLLNSAPDAPRYSRVKPNPEDIQKHFQQFIPKGEKPKPCCANPEDMDETVDDSQTDEAIPVVVADPTESNATTTTTPEISAMAAELSNVIGNPSYAAPVFYPSAGLAPVSGTITNLCSVLSYDPNAEVSIFNGAMPAISTGCASSLIGGTNFTATNSILTSGQTSSPDGLYFMQTSPQITDETEKSPTERAKPGRKPASYYKNKETK